MSEIAYCSESILNDQSGYNVLINEFMTMYMGFSLYELIPTIQYVATFLALPFNYDLPLICQVKDVMDVSISVSLP